LSKIKEMKRNLFKQREIMCGRGEGQHLNFKEFSETPHANQYAMSQGQTSSNK